MEEHRTLTPDMEVRFFLPLPDYEATDRAISSRRLLNAINTKTPSPPTRRGFVEELGSPSRFAHKYKHCDGEQESQKLTNQAQHRIFRSKHIPVYHPFPVDRANALRGIISQVKCFHYRGIPDISDIIFT